MTERQNTNNPIPSNELADLNDNTIIMDEFTNSKEDYTKDRFGNEFKTREKILTDLQKAVDDISSGAGFLPITGGTVTGSVKIEENLTVDEIISEGTLTSENDQNSDLRLLTKTGNRDGYIVRRYGVDFFIYKADDGKATDKIAQYSGETDTWDFNTKGLTKNTVPVAIENQLLGVVQGWYDVTSKREPGTVYTNNTGQPIMWSVSCKETGGWNTKFFINWVQVGQASWANVQLGLSFIVPVGAKYFIDQLANYPKNIIWAELRNSDT